MVQHARGWNDGADDSRHDHYLRHAVGYGSRSGRTDCVVEKMNEELLVVVGLITGLIVLWFFVMWGIGWAMLAALAFFFPATFKVTALGSLFAGLIISIVTGIFSRNGGGD